MRQGPMIWSWSMKVMNWSIRSVRARCLRTRSMKSDAVLFVASATLAEGVTRA